MRLNALSLSLALFSFAAFTTGFIGFRGFGVRVPLQDSGKSGSRGFQKLVRAQYIGLLLGGGAP